MRPPSDRPRSAGGASAAGLIRQVLDRGPGGPPDSFLARRLDVLATSLDARGPLTDIGRRLVADEVQRSVRLRHHCQRASDGSDSRLSGVGSRRLVVICGLPRTGSTALHRMLTLYPGTAGIDLATGLARFAVGEERRRTSRGRLGFLELVAPSFTAGHPMGVDEVEECVAPLAAAGAHALVDMLVDAPGAGIDAMAPEDRRRAIVDHLDVLLPALVPPDAPHVVLKSPFHAMWLADLRLAAPHAQVVLLERDLERVVSSWVSMLVDPVTATRGDVDVARLAAGWRHRWARVRAEVEAHRSDPDVLVIAHDRLREDSPAVASEVAERIGLDREAISRGERGARRWLAAHPPHAFGARPYAPAPEAPDGVGTLDHFGAGGVA